MTNVHFEFFDSYSNFELYKKTHHYSYNKEYKNLEVYNNLDLVSFFNNIIKGEKSFVFNHFLDEKKLFRAAIVVGSGGINAYNRPIELLKWRFQVLKVFLDFSTGNLRLKNFKYLDSSEKTAIMYFLGMVFAQYNAHFVIGVRFLFHLDNKSSLNYQHYDYNQYTPDLCGIDERKGVAYLIEAKGTSQRRRYGVEKAKEQLESIKNITFKNYNSKFSGKNIRKMISSLHLKSNEELRTTVIDPDKSGKIEIEADRDLLIFDYYSNIFWCLFENDLAYEEANYRKVVLTEGITIGLRKELYNSLVKHYKLLRENENINGLYNEINDMFYDNHANYEYDNFDDHDIQLSSQVIRNLYNLENDESSYEMNGILLDLE